MVRYSNQPLPERPRIAVLANDALGNFVMATPLLQLLRAERKPESIDYYGGTRTKELQEASDLIDRSFLLHGVGADQIRSFLERKGQYDLIVNLESTALAKTMAGLLAEEGTMVCGPSIGPGGRGELPFPQDERGRLWQDREWIRASLSTDYPILPSGFISEIFCRLCYLIGPLPDYRVPREEPERPIPDVILATAASLPEKLWPMEHWREVVARLRRKGLSVGLVGAPPKLQAELWRGAEAEESLVGENLAEDLRGKFTLPEVVGAVGKTRLVLTLDNGILHLAVAAGTRTIGLYRHGIHRLWAPPSPHLQVLTPGEGREVPDLSIQEVWTAVEKTLG